MPTTHTTSSINQNSKPTGMSIGDLLNPANPEKVDPSTPNGAKPKLVNPDVQAIAQPAPFRHVELARLHRHFAHANARKLYNMLHRSQGEALRNTMAQIEGIIKSCAICAEYGPRPVSFRVREADKVMFNHRITLDLVWLPSRVPQSSRANRPALHIVDTGTRFNAATFINGESASEVWNAFLRCWSTLYTGMPNSMLVDQGSVFLADEWIAACELQNIELVSTGTESHNPSDRENRTTLTYGGHIIRCTKSSLMFPTTWF